MISALRLYNFKAFADQTIEMRPLTLLTGLNGMGKSSVLQSLLLLRQSYQERLLETTGLVLNGDLTELGTGVDVFFDGAEDSNELGFDITLDDNRTAYWRFDYNRQSNVLSLSDAQDSTLDGIYETPLFTDNFHYLQAERVGPRVFSEMSDYLVRQHRQIGPRGEFALHFLATFGQETVDSELLCHQSMNFDPNDPPRLRVAVEAWMREISPGTRINVEMIEDLDLVRATYAFERVGQTATRNYRPTNVGFGISYTLPVLVALLSANRKPEPDTEPKPDRLVLLENPEAHLHPKGQFQIGDLIACAASSGTQIVLETHSDHILNGIRVAVREGKLDPDAVALHFFQRPKEDGQGASVAVAPLQIDADGRIDNWPPNFFDEYSKSLRKLM